jgi:fermentation-respiration switch protein FrsA (DUF1100 family)
MNTEPTSNTNLNDGQLTNDLTNHLANRPSWFARIRKWIKRILLIMVIGYVGIVVFLMVNENSLVYPGSKYPRGNWRPNGLVFDEVEFESKDGTKLVGWFLPQTEVPDNKKRAVLICHGNAENVAHVSVNYGEGFRDLLGADVFVFDYRGYGKSEGSPFEQGVLEDSEAAFDWLCKRIGKQHDEIIIVGHSIGGGPGVHLAGKFGCKALILQRTFSQLTAPAQTQYPWIPVKYIMQNQYRSTDKIKNYFGPLFQSHGDADRLIPIEFAKELFECAPTEQKRFFEVPGMTHWDVLPYRYWEELKAFIENVAPIDGDSPG